MLFTITLYYLSAPLLATTFEEELEFLESATLELPLPKPVSDTFEDEVKIESAATLKESPDERSREKKVEREEKLLEELMSESVEESSTLPPPLFRF